jgi:magnesium transporter
LAVTLGVLLGILAYFYVSDIKWFSVTVGAAISGAMIAASVWGAFLPLLFHRLQIDPAVATQPFVSTTIDIVSSLIYFSIAAWLLL